MKSASDRLGHTDVRAPIPAQPGAHTLPGIVDKLETDIVFGRLHPRERLIEDDLMARFGAKRHLVRQALVELERMGLVRRTRNRGGENDCAGRAMGPLLVERTPSP